MSYKNKKYVVGQNTDKDQPKEFYEKVVQIDRVTRTVKGGHRMRFRALVVVGDKKGKVGFGLAKASEVALAVAKATKEAKNKMVVVPIVNNTIPNKIIYHDGAARIILQPAKEGTSVIAGGSIRPVVEAAGIKNIVAKIIGTNNKVANVRAAVLALSQLKKD